MTMTTFSSEVPSFADLEDDFLRLTVAIGWCTVATVDRKDRPRSRILHVSWEIRDGRPVGWVSTGKSPTKTTHLTHNPYVSCSYWNPAHDAVFVDCRASWVEDEATKGHVWTLVETEAKQRGFDAYAVWPGGAGDAGFQVLRLDPWRAQVTLQDLEHGQTIGSSRVWHAEC
jgi:general stress protein 26